MSFFSWLRKRKPARRPQTHRLLLEPLEDRVVPTVVFDPQFPKETVSAGPYNVINNPTLYLIFWGTNWGSGQALGPSAVTKLTNDATAVISSPYFGGLSEYGNIGTVRYGGSWTDSSSDPPPNFDPGTPAAITSEQAEVTAALSNNSSWVANASSIFVAIPVSNSDGYNGQGTATYQGSSVTVNICSVGGASNATSGTTTDNFFTQTFSHEVAERISDPSSGGVTIAFSTNPTFPGYINETTNPPNWNNNPSLAGNQPYLANSGQIGDGEQEPGAQPHYGYLLNGQEVQSFWSASTPDKNGNPGAFIVPDGNADSVYLDPIWPNGVIPNPATGSATNPPIIGPVFTGNYNLTIQGNAIIVDASDSLTTVGVDSETFNFANFGNVGKIQQITVEPTGANATVLVRELSGDQTVVIGGNGADTVTIGSGFFSSSTQAVQGHVVIDNTSASTTIMVDDAGDTTAQNFTVGTNGYDANWGFVHEAALPNFHIDFRYGGTSSLQLYTGTVSGNIVGVWQDGVPTLIWSYGPGTTVNVGNGINGLDDLLASLTIHGSGSGSVFIDDRANSNPITTDTITSSTVTRNAPGYPVSHDASITYSGLSSLELDAGGFPNYVFVESDAAPTTVKAGSGTVLVGVGSQAENLDNLPAPLTVNGSGATALVINDQNNPNLIPTTDTITSGTVTRNAIDVFGQARNASISYSGLGSLELDTGATLNVVNVQSTASPTTVQAGTGTLAVNVGDNTNRLDGIQGALAVNGQSGGNTALNVNDQGTTTSQVYDLSATDVQRGTQMSNTFVPNIAAISYSNIANLGLNAGSGGNIVNVESTAAATITDLFSGTGNDTVNVYATQGALYDNNPGGTDYTDVGAGNMAGINGSVHVYGAGSTNLALDDWSNPIGKTAYLYDGEVTGLSLANIYYTPTSSSTGGVIFLEVLGGSGGNTFNVENTSNLYYFTTLYTGTGNDTVNVYGTTGDLYDYNPGGSDSTDVGLGNMTGINGSVYAYGAGSTTMLVDDHLDTKARPAATLTSSQLTGLGNAGTIYYNPLFYNSGVTSLTVSGGSGSDTWDINSTSAGTPVTVKGGISNDTFNVGSSNSLGGIQGTLTVNGGGGTNTLNANDSSSASGQSYTLSKTMLTRGGIAAISYASLSTINVTASGNDNLTISSSPAVPSITTNFNGGTGTNTLIGANVANSWIISGVNSGKLDSVNWSNFQNLAGGTSNDTFSFPTSTASIAGTINGGGGTDKLSYSTLGSSFLVNVTLASNTAGSAPLIAGSFSNISSVAGSTDTANTLIAPNLINQWTLSGANTGKVNTFAFTGMPNLIGGTNVDAFKISSSTATVLSINGGGAPARQDDWLDYSSLPSTSTVTVNLAAGSATNVNAGAAGAVTGIQNVIGTATGTNNLIGNAQGNILIGGSGTNTIVGSSGSSLLIGGSGSGSVTGGSGTDILIAGKMTYNATTAAGRTSLMAILAELQSADNFAQKVYDLIHGTDSGDPYGHGSDLNGVNKLTWGSTVLGSSGVFTLSGDTSASAAADWFFANASSTVSDFNDDGVNEEHNNNAIGAF